MSRSRPAGQGCVTPVGFDQHGADIIAAWMTWQDPDDVVTLPCAQADHAYPSRRCMTNRI